MNNIINSSDPGMVVKETTVHLSDEKLRSVLLHTYERAQKDMSNIKFRNFYGVFLSIAGTLLLSLLTSTFGSIGTLSASIVTIIAWAIFIVSAILGFILLGISVVGKSNNNTSERDVAIDEIFKQYLFDERNE